MTISIEPATPADIPALAGVLARAFLRDPMVAWPMAGADELEARIRRHYETVDTGYAAEGWMYRAADGLGALSLIPPGSGERQAQIDAVAAEGIREIGPDGGARYERLWAWVEACHPPERHWLLDQLAVEPSSQGQGIGGEMLRFSIEHARADELPLFLETGVASNVALYQRFGFTVMGEGDAPDGGPHVWFMRWDPGRPA